MQNTIVERWNTLLGISINVGLAIWWANFLVTNFILSILNSHTEDIEIAMIKIKYTHPAGVR